MRLEKIRACVILAMMLLISISLPVLSMAEDNYPSKPIELVNPGGPGGPLPLGLHYFSDKWAEFLGQPVVINNKPGAMGLVGTKFAAMAKPDGYTLLGTSPTAMVSGPLTHKDPGYSLDSFRFLFAHSKICIFFSVQPNARWKTLNDFIEEAKANPGKLKYSCWGKGTSPHLAVEMLSRVAGFKITMVPFATSPEALNGLMGGNVDMAVTVGLSGGIGKSGKVTALAVSDTERVPTYPEVPTLKELGYNIDYTSQELAVAVPARVPDNIVAKLVDAHNRVWEKYGDDIRDKLPKMDQIPIKMDGERAMKRHVETTRIFREFYREIGLAPK
jgi:tripartite-type tricarboxylate transporter receptor subunit TctC